jgi:hypothetical protein
LFGFKGASTSEVATAALRFGHSMVSNGYARFNKNDQQIDDTLEVSLP